MTRGAHLRRARCARCGGVLGPDDAPHDACRDRPRMTKVLVTVDVDQLDALRGEGEGRSEVVRRLVAAELERDGRGPSGVASELASRSGTSEAEAS